MIGHFWTLCPEVKWVPLFQKQRRLLGGNMETVGISELIDMIDKMEGEFVIHVFFGEEDDTT